MQTRQNRVEEANKGTPHEEVVSRRGILGYALTGAVLAGVTSRQQASAQGVSTRLSPRRRDPVMALVNRITMGYNERTHNHARNIGFDAFLEQQLDWESINDSALDTALETWNSLFRSPRWVYSAYSSAQHMPLIHQHFAATWRCAKSGRQLRERMWEFWSDHLTVDGQKDMMFAFLPEYQDRVIRRHALGNFPEMLRASAASGAMSFYLDNHLNVAGAPNENYARELMELHTLGVDGGYHEQDVKEVARCFTGWAYGTDPFSVEYGRFVFNPGVHDFDEKQVLGQTIAAGGGIEDALQVLDILARHPSTARFLSEKLCRWMLSYEPPTSIIDEVAACYLATSGDIKSMLRCILTEENLRVSGALNTSKIRRPFHYMISMVRAVNADIQHHVHLFLVPDLLGNMPLTWPAPDGFPDNLDHWGGAAFTRWQAAHAVFKGGAPFSVTSDSLQALLGTTPANEIARRLNEIFTGGDVPPDQVAWVQSYIDGKPITNLLIREAFTLFASTPAYQMY